MYHINFMQVFDSLQNLVEKSASLYVFQSFVFHYVVE